MARINLEMPDKFEFSIEMPIRIYDINYGKHLGNDAVLRMMHEARLKYFNKYGLNELDVNGTGLVISDAAVIYKSQGFYGDILMVEIAARELNRYGFDLYYRMTSKNTGKEVSRAKTGIVFFDYNHQKVARVPDKFRKIFFPESGEAIVSE